ncbi:hypothetical protein GCM10022215_41320 [Nocardioides fonticola]|uniref:Uncharacterized protein n=1 Tax=Nocardioides fonticola TaxID=450363 RepID=A0ABP7Y1H8_9ACTN
MSSEDDVATDPGGEIAVVDGDAPASADPMADAAPSGPNWWHREHPVFAPLSGFFAGMFFIILVPGLYGAVLNWLLDYDTAESLYPFVLIALAVPIGLVVYRPSRRFGRYMMLGIVSTLVVVGSVAAAVLWYLIHSQA